MQVLLHGFFRWTDLCNIGKSRIHQENNRQIISKKEKQLKLFKPNIRKDQPFNDLQPISNA